MKELGRSLERRDAWCYLWGVAGPARFFGYILQDPYPVATLKAVLSEATNLLGVTYHLASGVRDVLRERRELGIAIADGAAAARVL